ncbi:hypothetical protein PENTCL1PPCAC_6771 [Pristionchus entomophagus]|uniref:EF-hand domain-containing protein n=1 Tax=Pristionchus entomophagus TaxID=358040 RepID=A0AAV5SMK2_9BILA|nr:hypothetical protein PENTCL1PPCAC_6771 [Pristionchus entomophagus]
MRALIVAASLVIALRSAPITRDEDKVHMEGLPIEKNGELNDKFRQEILLGGDDMNEEETKKAIDEMLKECDKNGDGRLNVDELEMRIKEKKTEHLNESVKEARELKGKLDTNKDGKISWDEYSTLFIKNEEMEINKSSGAVIGSDNALRFEDEKSSFKRADEDDDGVLDDNEFKILLHPENSKRMIRKMGRDVVDFMDKDKDGFVSEKEFVNGIPGEIEESMKEFEEKEKSDRKREFIEDIDRDKNGMADLDEFLAYLDTTNGDNARREARQILSDADENDDGFLSRDELFSKHFLLKDSSIFSARGSMHYDL